MKLIKGTLILSLVILLVGMLLSAIVGAEGVALDYADGGDAQVIPMVTAYSGDPQRDLTYSEANRNNAEANQRNAEGDASTTVSNSEAILNYATVAVLMIWIVVVVILVSWVMKT